MRILFLFFFASTVGFTQPPLDRYNSDLFPNYTETSNIQFSTAVPQPNPGGGFYEFITGLPLNVDEYDTSPVNLSMDIFEPTGDTLSKRPLIIIAFGGGFLSGSRDHWSIRLLCQDLAKRGYVTAAIDYRLGMNVFDSDLANRAVYRGLQDARSAVRFFRADAAGANIYKIDPNQIYLGGHSSGAFAALHNAYLEKESERPLSTYAWTQDGNAVADQGCLDCVGDNQTYSGHANAVFSLAGALGFTSFIETSNDPKVVMFHSTDDDTVPYDSGEPFSGIIWLVIGSDLPDVYGSLPISQQATSVGLPYDFFSYTNRGHGVHEDGSNSLYSDIIPGISDWFFQEELKPIYTQINGDSTVCDVALQKDYSLDPGTGVYFDWQVTGGTFVQLNNYDSQVTVDWDANAAIKKLTVTPYSALDAKGDELTININVLPVATNTFNATNSIWEDQNNWNQGHVPNQCEHVILPNGVLPQDLTISSTIGINSLQIGENLNVLLTGGHQLFIHQQDPTYSDYALEVAGTLNNQGIINIQSTISGKELKMLDGGNIDNGGVVKIGGM